ncbi:PREDICTED: facilitated trehalose transporter Tret1-like [Nicrophorus vespilloides]|uniref:Facilitated trehalose transporter Tret1-like n=1 Tax=Nicrophorus vespilloides TaxID=110193 RepID=A0ABM1M8M8_NICVS|nr:PREDICTED: facilitated trehalose transporter Tret1-like [Nicrophorus vespilloides]
MHPERKEDENTPRFLYFCVATINLASFTCGTAFAWSSPSIPRLHEELLHPPDTTEESLIASLLAVGSIFSPFLAFISDVIGRKKAVILATVPIYSSFLLIAFGTQLWCFFLARFLSGFSIGWYFVIIPNYVAEISEKHNRGRMSCFLVLNITLGNLLIYCMGPYLSLLVSSFICLIAPTLLICLMLKYVPESPYYLMTVDRKLEAEESLRKLRGLSDVLQESEDIQRGIKATSQSRMTDLFHKRSLIKCLLITIGLVTFQQFSGVNAILFYLQTVFLETGSELEPEISSIVVAVVQFTSSTITPFLVDRLGRKFLLYVSGIGTLISLITLGLFFYLKSNNYSVESLSLMPILSLMFFIFSYTVGFGPMPFTILGEIFPQNVKSAASTLTVSISSCFTFITTLFFPYLLQLVGFGISMWLFAAFCLVSLFFTYFFVPETKGKSLQEIQKMLNL